MRDNEKARPSAATLRRAEDKLAFCETMPSTAQSTTAAPSGQQSIAALLGVGKDNGLTGAQLARLTGVDRRTVQDMVSRERIAGAPICADAVNGYFLGESADEVRRCAKGLFRRAHAVRMAAAGMLRACHDGRQMVIDEDGGAQ